MLCENVDCGISRDSTRPAGLVLEEAMLVWEGHFDAVTSPPFGCRVRLTCTGIG